MMKVSHVIDWFDEKASVWKTKSTIEVAMVAKSSSDERAASTWSLTSDTARIHELS